ncbi:hypothetical protein F4814DRAFT_451138 [Daldinia grandis]|nr:hypothetical protein F4814DRAFT_451138 [Daldinia grandis]
MFSQEEAELMNKIVEILEELEDIPRRVTKVGGTNLEYYLITLREALNVLSKRNPKLRGHVLNRDVRQLMVGYEDTIKPETVEELRNFLINAAQYAKPSGREEVPLTPSKKDGKPRHEVEDVSEGHIRRCTFLENETIKALIELFLARNESSPPTAPPRPDLRTRAVHPSQDSSSKRPKRPPSYSPRQPPKGKEKMPPE